MTQKILLVEDDATTADFIVKGLHEQGLAVDHAKTGRDGLFHAIDGSYDAIILDRMLPGMDGMAVLGAIRAAQLGKKVACIERSKLGGVCLNWG
ncbi:MAG: response regulator, partial [Sphingomonadaceae bacterium]|nr:response regulator [Sphingomonadaceae bacterium]